jgi:hypothetical protein
MLTPSPRVLIKSSGCSPIAPEIGRARPELLANLRSFPVGRGIEVVRVLHGARDLKPLFEQESDNCDPAGGPRPDFSTAPPCDIQP